MGSLLTWPHDDWYALAPDVWTEFRTRTGTAGSLLAESGAAEFQDVEGMRYVEIVGMRDPQAGAALGALRDRGLSSDVFIIPPTFSEPYTYRNKAIALDWQNTAADLPAAWAQLPDPDGPDMHANILVRHIDTRATRNTRCSAGPSPTEPGFGRISRSIASQMKRILRPPNGRM